MKTRVLYLLLAVVFVSSISSCDTIRKYYKAKRYWKEMGYDKRRCDKERGVYVPCDCPDYLENTELISRSSHYVGNFTIRKIGLYNGMYIIYAQKGDSIYKIYSRKERNVPAGGKRLRVDSTYYLQLYPLFRNDIHEKTHCYTVVAEYPVVIKNTDRKYCVWNVFCGFNIVGAHAYDRHRCFKFVSTVKKDSVCPYPRLKKFKEPKIKLPAEWDNIPQIRARQQKL